MGTNKVQIHGEESVQNVGPSKIRMVYQRFGNPAFTPVFLIMGAGAQMINWPEGFCLKLAGHDLHPIRFDNRDAGLSTHFSDAPVPDFAAIQSGDFFLYSSIHSFRHGSRHRRSHGCTWV